MICSIVWSHNPYFNRWFSAMGLDMFLLDQEGCHNPYFNRWFSAIFFLPVIVFLFLCHNPYFNRWFSAIGDVIYDRKHKLSSQSLF